MIEKKNIDRLFQEQFKDFEADPGEHVWENIEEALRKKKKRRVIPIWFQVAGVAAALILGMFIGSRFIDFGGQGKQENVVVTDSIPEQNENVPKIRIDVPVEEATASGERENSGSGQQKRVESPTGSKREYRDSESNDSQSVINSNSQISESGSVKNRAIDQKTKTNSVAETPSTKRRTNDNDKILSDSQEAVAVNQINKDSTNDNNVPQQKENSSNPVIVSGIDATKIVKPGDDNAAQKTAVVPVDRQIALRNEQNSNKDIPSEKSADNAVAQSDIKRDSTEIAAVEPNALEELASEKENKVTVTEPKLNRWQLTSNVAPIYFSSTANGSPLDSRFENAPKAYKTSMSYGVGVAYAISKKFSVRSGVNSVALEYNTTDLVFFQTPNARLIQNVRTNVQGSLIEVDANPGEFNLAARAGDARFDGLLNQKIGYIEVPVELSYKFLDKKFGVELIGGFSTLILNQNEVSVSGAGFDMNIGEANNLNDMHFSTNIGLGLKYNFLKTFQLKLEPILKYQINTFSGDAGNFKPYFFGVYTGLNYRF